MPETLTRKDYLKRYVLCVLTEKRLRWVELPTLEKIIREDLQDCVRDLGQLAAEAVVGTIRDRIRDRGIGATISDVVSGIRGAFRGSR